MVDLAFAKSGNPPDERPLSRWERLLFGRHPRRTLLRLLILTLGSFVAFHFLLVPIRVVGKSMLPTYQDGRVNFVYRLSYLRRKPSRGDVVAVQSIQGGYVLIKRIVGLPGEEVAIRRGRIYINGHMLDESYTHTRVPAPNAPRRLAADQYFVIGDNREISVFGAVNQKEILGKILF